MLRAMRMAYALIVLAACGKKDPDWITDAKPKMQAALDAQRALAPKLLPLVDKATTATPCKPPAGVVPVLSRELLAELGRGEHELRETKEVGAYPFLAGQPYRVLLGGLGYLNPTILENGIADVMNAKAIGVLVGDKVDTGKIDGNTIVRPGTFEGRFVLVSLPDLAVLGSVPIHAKTNDWMTSSGSLELELRNNLGSNVYDGAVAGCPGLALERPPT